MDKNVYVYGLVDPAAEEYFYVGVTARPEERLAQHRSGKPKCSSAMSKRLEAMATSDNRPEMVILETTNTRHAFERENYWIDFLRGEGNPLENIMKTRPDKTMEVLPIEKVRELTLRALAGESPTKLAQEYGVARSRVYQIMDEAREADPQERLRELEAEAAFWRRIKESR